MRLQRHRAASDEQTARIPWQLEVECVRAIDQSLWPASTLSGGWRFDVLRTRTQRSPDPWGRQHSGLRTASAFGHNGMTVARGLAGYGSFGDTRFLEAEP